MKFHVLSGKNKMFIQEAADVDDAFIKALSFHNYFKLEECSQFIVAWESGKNQLDGDTSYGLTERYLERAGYKITKDGENTLYQLPIVEEPIKEKPIKVKLTDEIQSPKCTRCGFNNSQYLGESKGKLIYRCNKCNGTFTVLESVTT